jgi:hypothetical protein
MILEFYGRYSSFVYAALMGIFWGLAYDVFRVMRIARMPYIIPDGAIYRFIKIPDMHNASVMIKLKKLFRFSDTLATFVEDIVFWIFISLSAILFVYHVNGGIIRIYFFLYAFLGAALYFFTFGRLTVYFAIRIIFLIRSLLNWLFYIIIYPIRMIFLILKSILSIFTRITVLPLVNIMRKRIARKYSEKRIRSILEEAKKGFYKNDGSKKEKNKHYS